MNNDAEFQRVMLNVVKTADDGRLVIGESYIVFRNKDLRQLRYKIATLEGLNGNMLIFNTTVNTTGSNFIKTGVFTLPLYQASELVYAKNDILDEIEFEKKLEGGNEDEE